MVIWSEGSNLTENTTYNISHSVLRKMKAPNFSKASLKYN